MNASSPPKKFVLVVDPSLPTDAQVLSWSNDKLISWWTKHRKNDFQSNRKTITISEIREKAVLHYQDLRKTNFVHLPSPPQQSPDCSSNGQTKLDTKAKRPSRVFISKDLIDFAIKNRKRN